MPVPHARATAVTSTDDHAAGQVPGLLEVLAQVPDPRKRRGRTASPTGDTVPARPRPR